MTPAVFRITDRREELPGTFTLRLSPEQADAVTAFRPGQFNMLYSFGAGEVPISMSGPLRSGEYVHTIRSLGMGTQALERLRVGETVGVRGPFGNGWPLEAIAGRNAIVVAGGLGLAPLRPLLYTLLDSDTRVWLFYGARTPADILYREELEQWAQQIRVEVTVDAGDDSWEGHIAVVPSLLESVEFPVDNSIAFICGPEIMMHFSIQELLNQGLPAAAIYISMERNMKCAVGHCGHCQWGPAFICRDGPVFCYEDIQSWLQIREL